MHIRTSLGFALLATLAACGGGGGGSSSPAGSTAGTNPNENTITLQGVAAVGRPIVNGLVTITGANGSGSIHTTTDMAGRYIAATQNLQYPLTIVVEDRNASSGIVLRSLALSRQSGIAHAHPITTAILDTLGSDVTAQRLRNAEQRVGQALQAYAIGGDFFFEDPDFRADSGNLDGALDLVEVSTANGDILLSSKIDRSLSTRFSATGSGDVGPLPSPDHRMHATPTEIASLVQGLNQALENEGLGQNSLENVLHTGFKDDDGFELIHLREAARNIPLGTNGYDLLACTPDSETILDRCYIRVFLRVPLLSSIEDFGGENLEEQFELLPYNLVIERRMVFQNGTATGPGPLKFAGGANRPLAATVRHVFSQTVVARPDGTAAVIRNPTIAVEMFVPVPQLMGSMSGEPGENSNTNALRVELLRTQNGNSNVLAGVRRAGNNECTNAPGNAMVVNPTNSANCSTVLEGSFVQSLAEQAQMKELSLAFYSANGSNEVRRESLPIHLGRPTVVNSDVFAKLNRASLRALHNHGTAQNTPESVTIALEPAPGFASVCIVDGRFESGVCVRERRSVRIPSTLLRGQTSSYVLLALDHHNNIYLKTYELQPL
ncbi:MAG TPA: hypothetical protein VFV43_06960 [Limnobacter sp.]|nr:hypothetical protein [Limnobacter sp.]